MSDYLQTEQQAEQQPEQHQRQLSFIERFQQKLSESRYFMLSCVIHTVIVIVAGGIILVKSAMDDTDFTSSGSEGLISGTEDLSPPPETPQDAVPTEAVQPDTPNLSSPTIDVISTTANTSNFKVAPTQISVKINTSTDLAKTSGALTKGIAGGLGNIPGTMKGRFGAGRKAAAAATGQRPPAELAVLKGLEWLQKVQNPDGSWGDANKGGMTGLALLCFLGHGETPDSPQFGLTVNKAVQWILDTGTKNDGHLNMAKAFSQPGVYEHGICTYALGEYFTITQDGRVQELFKQAIGYIIQGQGPGGGWMYSYDKSADDLSVSGWQIQALKAAHLSKLEINGVDQALEKAMSYLERVKGPKGGYGYRKAEDRYSLSGVGVLCQLFWKGERSKLRQGMEWILEETEKSKPVKYKSEHADLYAWYYHTQACLMFGGSAWTKWNKWFQDELVNVQNPNGSWPAPGFKGHGPQTADSMTGQVYRTTLCILMLEVFYRYMPTTQA